MRLARVLLIALCAAVVEPLTLPSSPLGRVNDYAGILSADARSRIESSLAAYDAQTSTEIVIVTFRSLEGGSLEDVSMRLAEKWKIGKKKKDNGVILIFALEERVVRIEVGYGLEGTITDAVSSSIIRTVIAPKFRTGDYDGGTADAVNALMKAAAGEYTADASDGGELSSLANDPTVRVIVLIALAVIVFLFIIDLVRYMGYKRTQSGNGGRYGLLEWFLLFSALLFFIKLVLQIAYYALLARGGGGGRGFSGGGGSFGGGGASGKW